MEIYEKKIEEYGLKKMLTYQQFKKLKEKYRILKKSAEILSVEDKDLPRVIERFQKEIEEMKKRLELVN